MTYQFDSMAATLSDGMHLPIVVVTTGNPEAPRTVFLHPGGRIQDKVEASRRADQYAADLSNSGELVHAKASAAQLSGAPISFVGSADPGLLMELSSFLHQH